ncbi:uncharacterized protein LOC105447575 isoform X2 [Strongylocentrotus purpuratus]|uniref:Uncharacterized protein n=1 Tax=Strongylocentrotus purpuratus TaxID=7668 RepID=A0A7M7PF37_STRPU|nr:uncharacterized protein LOC105447575 isoform X2 [Strongylocentrotus purpuratus]
MFSRASLVFVYNVAMFFRAKAYEDKAVIMDGPENPTKLKKALQARKADQANKGSQKNAVQGSSASKAIQGATASNFISDLPEAEKIKLTAKGDTLVLTIEGSRLLSLCNSYPDIQINVPRPVL